ncbi:hypothetical protein CPB84DRAFT_1769422 [Gymnopilus junonius]|uniref:Uncharacterized protein n=1 Tax=Gymnopilus junonius TaxID=109634 RepID=A0A9P5NVX3_GYMJU|nr:hypothetical protein CPB84DRAFT_1769422 [Gymnopilus junonius]
MSKLNSNLLTALKLHHQLKKVLTLIQLPKYSIFAYGCSPRVYRGIDDLHKTLYALLLSLHDFLGEYPHQNNESLKAVQRMKPFWKGRERIVTTGLNMMLSSMVLFQL